MKLNLSFLIMGALTTIFITACSGGPVSLSNSRMSTDPEGTNVVQSYASTDVFHVVADLTDAPSGTRVDVKWQAVDVSPREPGLINESSFVVEEDGYSGTVHFQLNTELAWPSGSYVVDLYLDGTLVDTVEFTVQ